MGKISLDVIEPVRVKSVADHVVEQLQKLILEGTLSPGDQLPSESELSRALGVGRSTVREAKQVLIARGLVLPLGRSGALIGDPSAPGRDLTEVIRALRDPSHADVHEVREIVEIAACKLAATRVTTTQIKHMRETLDDIEHQSQSGASDAWPRSLEIHKQIVQASQNKVLSSLYELIAQVLRRTQVPYLPYIADWNYEIESHRRLIDILDQGDPGAIAAEMTEHLAHSDKYRRDLLASGAFEDVAGGTPST